MTLPKSFTLASKDFNNFNTMSLEATTSTDVNTLLRQQQQQQNPYQQGLQSLNVQHPTMSSLSSRQAAADNSIKSNTMFNSDAALPPALQYSPSNNTTQLKAEYLECVMPGIFLTKDFISWKEEQLRAYTFTHIIIIDKHIQELYYPNQQPDIFKLYSSNEATNKRPSYSTRRDDSSCSDAFDYYCPPVANNHLEFGKEFKVIDLNFGEKSYLTTVLPNCYRAVKFINKALQAGGTILVIDCNGGEQKCLTIVVAYLMYKHNISFSDAFARLKEFYTKADLDRFYISQLYEYEPILQVQRAQSRGHSCSRELHAAILKRKKTQDDDGTTITDNSSCSISTSSSSSSCYANTTTTTYTTATTTKELLNNCNPLNRFDTTQMDRQVMKSPNHTMTQDNRCHTFTRFMSGTTTGGWYNWDDYAME